MPISWDDPIFLTRIRQEFASGEKVTVSGAGGWKRDAHGVIVGGPEAVTTRQGEDYFYWVEFDEPERDLDGDGPYYKAQVLSQYITRRTA